MIEIIVSKTAGFCFGVDNAVKAVYTQLEKPGGKIYTYGSIIHNQQVVEYLNSKGVKVVNDISEITKPGSIVIRAHGVGADIYKNIQDTQMELIDATCPYVKKIHILAQEKYSQGYRIIIVGDKNHPEVIGINGWVDYKADIVYSLEDVKKLNIEKNKKICVVAQTTITYEKWEEISTALKSIYSNILQYNTICSATSKRQEEAVEISKSVDMMIVIGSNDSSNTQKLYELCKNNCTNTYKVETSGELPSVDIKKIKKIGITAGASTPNWVIKEVIKKMSEVNNMENEISFKDAFESSLVTLESGSIVKGKIIGFNNSEIYVDMGYKSDGTIAVSEYSDDPDFRPDKHIKIGDEVEVYIIRVNDGEGNVQLSKKKVDAIKGWDKIDEIYENKTTITAKVVDIVNGGVIAVYNGIRIFVPASQISDRFIKDLSSFLKQELRLRIIEINKQKRKLVGSQRVILEEEKSVNESKIWGEIQIGKTYKGTVKNIMDFGVFVDIGGVDGLVHISELSWSKIKHPSTVVKAGDVIEVTVQEFDKDKKKISLGYRKHEDNPWVKAASKYKIDDIIKGKVVRTAPFGAFIELEEGIDGLVHISQISSVRINKPDDVLKIGQMVEAKITELNLEAKKISLSIKEVNPIDPVKKDEPKVENSDTEEIPTEHKEDLSVTIGDVIKNVPTDIKE